METAYQSDTLTVPLLFEEEQIKDINCFIYASANDY